MTDVPSSVDRSATAGDGPTDRIISAAEFVAERLRRMIFSGELRAREFVVEQGLAASLGVSRTPVREAIKELCAEGLLVRNERGKTSVFAPSAKDLLELYEIRLILEPKAVAMAIKARPETDRIAIRHRFSELNSAPPGATWADAHEAFHRAMLSSPENQRLPGLIMSLRMQSDPYSRMFVASDPEFHKSAEEDHRMMAECMATGDAEVAAEIVERHLRRTVGRIEELIKRQLWL